MWMHLEMVECCIQFWVTVTLTSDQVSRIMMSRTYLLLEVGIQNLVCVRLVMAVSRTISGSL